jgi:hypothetical protein
MSFEVGQGYDRWRAYSLIAHDRWQVFLEAFDFKKLYILLQHFLFPLCFCTFYFTYLTPKKLYILLNNGLFSVLHLGVI